MGGQAQAFVISMRHDDATHQPRTHAPAALVHMLLLPVAVKELSAKRLWVGPGKEEEGGRGCVCGGGKQVCRWIRRGRLA